MYTKIKIAGFILIILHLVGAFSIASGFLSEYIIPLSPLNLLLSSAILIYGSENRGTALWLFLSASFLIGYFAEYIGVHTGLLFGDYTYGSTLGPKAFEIPLIIGINWFMLSYSFGTLLNLIKIPILLKVILVASFMTMLDFIIEPVAIKLGYWEWAGSIVPISNYLGWWVISALVASVFFVLLKNEKNRISNYLIVSQISFFIIVLFFS